MANTALDGKPYAGNPHVRIDEGDGASAKPRRSSLLYKNDLWTTKVILHFPFYIIHSNGSRPGARRDGYPARAASSRACAGCGRSSGPCGRPRARRRGGTPPSRGRARPARTTRRRASRAVRPGRGRGRRRGVVSGFFGSSGTSIAKRAGRFKEKI